VNDYKAKKSLGQHFLNDTQVVQKIIDAFTPASNDVVLEIGPGKGVLSSHLFERYKERTYLCDIDERSIALLIGMFPKYRAQIIQEDILQLDFDKHFSHKQVSVIGNFPYNISSQIIFKLLEHKEQVPLIVGMFQKEVAKRLAASHGNKEYGITTVLLQVYYDVQYLFDVSPDCFSPPPKVMSGVISVSRKTAPPQLYNSKLFVNMVKAGFNTRRKTLRNALASLSLDLTQVNNELLSKRAEQLSVAEWISFANELSKP
jgi:16S rRNA (adenine1518-N6/adenine1519-N6)-dimethyltransferase